MSPLANLLRAWRLRRVRWAMSTLKRRLAAYEAAYGRQAVGLKTGTLVQADMCRIVGD